MVSLEYVVQKQKVQSNLLLLVQITTKIHCPGKVPQLVRAVVANLWSMWSERLVTAGLEHCPNIRKKLALRSKIYKGNFCSFSLSGTFIHLTIYWALALFQVLSSWSQLWTTPTLHSAESGNWIGCQHAGHTQASAHLTYCLRIRASLLIYKMRWCLYKMRLIIIVKHLVVFTYTQ